MHSGQTYRPSGRDLRIASFMVTIVSAVAATAIRLQPAHRTEG